MTTALLPEGRQRYYNNDGTPAAGGKLYTYAAGTSALKTTYADEAGTTANPNPVPLDAKGEAVIYWDGAYKVDLKQADGAQVTGYPVDNIKTDPAGLGARVAALALATGAALVGLLLNAGGAVLRTLQDKLRESVSLDDFAGVDPTGAQDSTTGVLAAFAWLAGGNRRLYGSPGASYRVNKSIPVRGNGVTFDGRECIIINAINGPGGGAGADPLFAVTAASGNFVLIENFQEQFDQPANKGHTVSIIGNGQSPQAIHVRRIRPNYQVGVGKDKGGAAMAAYAVYAYGVYTVFCDEIYAQNGSGGLFFDTVQKVSLRRNTLDSCTNYGMWFDNCASVFVSDLNNLTGCGQDAQAAVYYNNCENFVFRGNRVKGGLGSEIMSGVTPSRSVTIADNHLEIYVANKNAIYAKTNTDSLTIENNYIKFIGGTGPGYSGICIDDFGVATQSRSSAVIRQNKILVGGADNLVNGILLNTATDKINAAVIESNTVGDRNAVAATITNAINLVCISDGGIRVANNTIGALTGLTVTNGVVLGAGVTSADVRDNPNVGTVTNPLVNNGNGTRRYLATDIVPVLKGKSTAGNHTYSKNIGTARMVGDVVHFVATVSVSALDAAINGFVCVELDSTNVGLPKVKNRASQWPVVNLAGEVFNTPAGTMTVRAYMQPNTSEVWFLFSVANAASVNVTQAHVTAAFNVMLSGSYVAG